MKKGFFLCIILFAGQTVFAQLPIDTVLNYLNRSLSLYQSVSPFDDTKHIDSLDLSPHLKAELLAWEYYDLDPEQIEPLTLQELYITHVDSAIKLLFNHPQLNATNLSGKIIDAGVIQTEDKRFTQIAFEENTGGTYRSRAVYYHYVGKEESFNTYYMSDDSNPFGLNSDGYHDVQLLGQKKDTSYYFFRGGVRGCSYCFSSTFGLLKATPGGIGEYFNYTIDSRSWGETIQIDFKEEGDSLIHVLYEADDLNNGCGCNEELTFNTFENAYEEEGAQYCYLRFRYHDFKFFLIKQSCLYPDPQAEEIPEEMLWEEFTR